jgi:electron transport complex protein RnfD
VRLPLYLLAAWVVEVLYYLLRDGRPSAPRASTLVTAGLLILSIPTRMPPFQVVCGLVVAVWFGKLTADRDALRLNPMLVGRLFMMIAFPNEIQQWLPPDTEIDAFSSATPLGLYAAEGAAYQPAKLLVGSIRGNWEEIYAVIPGSPGDALPLLSLAGGVLLYLLGVADWRPQVTFILGFAATCALLGMPVLLNLLAGSVFFTAAYIVTDMRSMPASRFGRLAAGLTAGVLNAAVRRHGYYPEGIVPAVLATNLLTPTFDRLAFRGRAVLIRRRAKRHQRAMPAGHNP